VASRQMIAGRYNANSQSEDGNVDKGREGSTFRYYACLCQCGAQLDSSRALGRGDGHSAHTSSRPHL